jgi:hypothetical protein
VYATVPAIGTTPALKNPAPPPLAPGWHIPKLPGPVVVFEFCPPPPPPPIAIMFTTTGAVTVPLLEKVPDEVKVFFNEIGLLITGTVERPISLLSY